MKYICATCSYETDRHSSYQKHLMTNKHIGNVKQSPKSLHVIPKNTSNMCKCTYCGKFYSNSSSLSRHKKICIERETLTVSHVNEIEKRDQEIAFLKEQNQRNLEYHKQLLQQQQAENAHLKSLINNAGCVIKTSVSALSYVVQNYNDAPILKAIKDYSYLEFADGDDSDSDDEMDLTQMILNQHKDKTITQYLGDIIVQAYKKDDPSKQSIWNSDSVRLTYIIRELINKNPDWTVDKKGVKTSQYIIAPLLEYIRKLMAQFMEDNRLENFLGDSDWKMKRRMDNLKAAGEICYNIKKKILEEQILKYIAPHFYLAKGVQLLEE